jgi:peroxiredoxin
MTRLKPILFFLLVGALAAFFVLRRPEKSVNVGDVAPELVLKDESGQQIKLSELRGNVVFLNFWGTWCEPCREEMPDMEALNAQMNNRKFKMVAVAVDTGWEPVRQFYNTLNLTLPSYLDPGRQASLQYDVTQFPETYLIDGRGIVQKHYIGAQAWMKPHIFSYIDSLVRQEEGGEASSLQ